MNRSKSSDSGLAEWLGKGRIVVCADAEEIAAMKAEVLRLRGRVDELLEIGTKLTEERRELTRDRDELNNRLTLAKELLAHRESIEREAPLKPNSRYEMVREFNKAIGAPVRYRPSSTRGTFIVPAKDRASVADGLALVVEEFCEIFEAFLPMVGQPVATIKLVRSVLEGLARQVAELSYERDLAPVVDGIVDTAYTLEGLMTRLGVDMDRMFRLVHENNMTKLGGPKDPVTGKQLKPEGYKPPDIVGEIERQARGQ